MRARIQQLESTKLAEAKVSEYKHKKTRGALRRLAQTQHDRKGEASCLGTSKLLLVLVIGDLHVVVVGIGNSCSWTRRLQRRLQRPIRQNSKGNKSSEYLIYPRVLRPATKLLCIINGYGGGCIVDCKIEIPR